MFINISIYPITASKKEVMNLKESEEEYTEDLEGGKRRKKYN